MIIRGFHDAADIVTCLAALAPTHIHVESLREVNQAEWDVLVTDERLDEERSTPFGSYTHRPVEGHLYVVYRAPAPGTQIVEGDSGRWSGDIRREWNHIRRELRRSADIPTRIQPLVEQLESVLRQRSSHEHFISKKLLASGPSAGHTTSRLAPPPLSPFAETADGRILAGRYDRSPTAEAWLLPSDVPDLNAWVSASLAEWHTRDRDRFPGSPEWSRQLAWATHDERQLLSDLSTVRSELEATLERLNERERELTAMLATTQQAADTYERALLTANNDLLVQAVLRALTELGFIVTDADLSPEQTEKLEDLRVEDPTVPGWVALGEVKGYGKGAQTGALTQFIRFERRYRTRTGRQPDALWYIANQFKDRDPASRQKILQGNEADVSNFAEVGGLLLDTVELFHLLDAVRSGRTTADEARRTLRETTGRFSTQAPTGP
ncbi:MAG: hypothetical protein ABIQ09_01485 [Jatrophihabitantaceae bacterium]